MREEDYYWESHVGEDLDAFISVAQSSYAALSLSVRAHASTAAAIAYAAVGLMNCHSLLPSPITMGGILILGVENGMTHYSDALDEDIMYSFNPGNTIPVPTQETFKEIYNYHRAKIKDYDKTISEGPEHIERIFIKSPKYFSDLVLAESLKKLSLDTRESSLTHRGIIDFTDEMLVTARTMNSMVSMEIYKIGQEVGQHIKNSSISSNRGAYAQWVYPYIPSYQTMVSLFEVAVCCAMDHYNLMDADKVLSKNIIPELAKLVVAASIMATYKMSRDAKTTDAKATDAKEVFNDTIRGIEKKEVELRKGGIAGIIKSDPSKLRNPIKTYVAITAETNQGSMASASKDALATSLAMRATIAKYAYSGAQDILRVLINEYQVGDGYER